MLICLTSKKSFMSSPKSAGLMPVMLSVFITCSTSLAQAQAVDVAAAEDLMTKSKCTQCHSVDKKKDGPPYRETAAKYKGKADAEARLIKHITSGPKIKIDGIEEEHRIVKSKDAAEIKNLVRFILSR